MYLSFEQFCVKHWDAVESFCRRVYPKQKVAFHLTLNSFENLRRIFDRMPEEDRAYTVLLIMARHECTSYGELCRHRHATWWTRVGRWILRYVLMERWSRRLIFGSPL